MENQAQNPIESSIATIGAVIESKWGGIIINFVLIPLLCVAALVLPPVNLIERVVNFTVGYETFDSSTGGSVVDADGTRIDILPEGMDGDVSLVLNPIPRDEFLRGETTSDLVAAAEQFPPNLVMKSPLYEIKYKGNVPENILMYVPIPNESQPYTTLDMYGWTGSTWEWLPGNQIVNEEILEAKLDYFPRAVVIVQTHPVRPYFSTNLPPGAVVPDNVKNSLVEVNPQGLFLDVDGQVGGDIEALPTADENTPYTIIPTIRNWEPSGVIRSDLIDNLLIDDQSRQAHIDSIVELVVGKNYAGIDIDYRGISPDLKGEYSKFIASLNEALPDTKSLSVQVGLPLQLSADTWDTGAYDWQSLGRATDVLKVPTPVDPRAYRPGGQMDAMLDWAVGQVSRYKIQLVISTKSLEEVNGVTREINYDEALSPFGTVNIASGTHVVAPGEEITFDLVGLQGASGIQYDANSGSYWFAYIDTAGVQRTVYIENAASIAKKLTYVATHNLRGVAVQNLLTEQNDSQIWDVVQQFLDLIIPQVESQFSVVWKIDKGEGEGLTVEGSSDLTKPKFTWKAPDDGGGVYEVAALISSDGGNSGSFRGKTEVIVASPTPTSTPTPTPEPTATPTPVPTDTPTPEPTATPKPASRPPSNNTGGGGSPAPAPVASSNVNVNQPFDYGIQVDPGNSAAFNIGHVQALGFRWVKFQMPWKDVEPDPGNLQWPNWDARINAYHSAGIKILLSIPKAPNWARPGDDDKSVEGPPADPQHYANFVGAVAGRYAGKVQAIEVWNEQNLYYEAGGQGRVNVDNYMNLLKLSYAAIKANNPNMIVVSGALTPTGAPQPYAVDDVLYLRQMYERGLKNVSDAIGAHPSGFANPPDALWQGGDFDPSRGYDDHRSFFFRNTMEDYRRLMVEFGDSNKTIWPTEFGWPVWRFHGDDRFVFAQSNSLEQQAQYTRRAYEMGKQWGWVGTMFLWNLDYAVTAGNTELANFGIIDGNGPTPAYYALQSMPK